MYLYYCEKEYCDFCCNFFPDLIIHYNEKHSDKEAAITSASILSTLPKHRNINVEIK